MDGDRGFGAVVGDRRSSTAADGTRGQVGGQLGSSGTPSRTACAHAVDLVEKTPASAGRWVRSRDVARATSASTYGGMPGTACEGGGTSVCTCL